MLKTLLLALALASPVGAQTACGVERWPVKTMNDPDTGLVQLTPVLATVDSLGQLPTPAARPADARVAPTETQEFEVRATLEDAFGEADGDVHMILQDSTGATMNAEIPDPTCASGSNHRSQFERARVDLRGIPVGTTVEVFGIGFFDYLHGQRGHAPNGIELHPVLRVRKAR